MTESPSLRERFTDFLYDPLSLMDDEEEEGQDDEPGLLEGAVEGIQETGANVGMTLFVNQLPGAGTLFNYSAWDGLSFTPLGRNILLAAAAYGAWRMLAGGR